MLLPKVIQNLAIMYRRLIREKFEFTKLDWASRAATITGSSGPSHFKVRLDFVGSPAQVIGACSICRQTSLCVHGMASIIMMDDRKIAVEIEKANYAPCQFGLHQKKAKYAAPQPPPENPWKTQLGTLADRFRYMASSQTEPVRFPPGRQAIYVMQEGGYTYGSDPEMIDIAVATRAITNADDPAKSKPVVGGYKTLSAGVKALGASTDPLDREIAEKIGMSTVRRDYYHSRQGFRFQLSPVFSRDLIGRLARSGRLFLNPEYNLNENIIPLGWVSDEPFDLKFEVSGHDPDHVRLGLCAIAGGAKIPQKGF